MDQKAERGQPAPEKYPGSPVCRLEIVTREDKLRQCGRCEGMGANMGAKDGRGDCGARQYHRARSKPPPRSTKACAMASPAAAKPTMLKTHFPHELQN